MTIAFKDVDLLKKCALAYSGGLDTSAMIPWLIDQGYQVHAVLVDVGQQEDLPALCDRARMLGAATAEVRDAKQSMANQILPYTIGLNATFEENYRLGTALARPFIALEQIKLAKSLGNATLIHGATGKGNDQIRFEYAYRSLAPKCPVFAPWKHWSFGGRIDLVEFLKSMGYDFDFETTKQLSLDENLWHLSVEGGPLEDPECRLNVANVLDQVADRFAAGSPALSGDEIVVQFQDGIPTNINHRNAGILEILTELNSRFRRADWAWDLVIENRVVGIKSRGLYINPAAKLLAVAVDALARCVFNKPTYDLWRSLGQQYGQLLYGGQYFSDQRLVIESAAIPILKRLNGKVTVDVCASPYAASINANDPLFRQSIATFEAGEFDHHDAEGFMKLNWRSSLGRPFDPDQD